MRNVFKDPELEERFQKDGYVIVPFLSPEKVKALQLAYRDSLARSGGLINSEHISYDFTFIDQNKAYKEEVFSIIQQAFEEEQSLYLDRYLPIIANFIRKRPHLGEVPLHQNWAFVDELLCSSISIWCPLVNSHQANGTLQLVPGSHKRFGAVRGPMIPWELEKIKDQIIAEDLIPMEVEAGMAVILDDSIVHYSAPNRTDELRLAIQLICIPEEFPSIHYHLNPKVSTDTVHVYEVDREFYMAFDPWKAIEHAKAIRTFKHQTKALSHREFRKRLYGPRIDRELNSSLYQKIKTRIFS